MTNEYVYAVVLNGIDLDSFYYKKEAMEMALAIGYCDTKVIRRRL